MNFKTIFEAWIIANNPTEKQKELAELRYEVCEKCPSKKTIVVEICGECGCPISKKIFTNEYNPCSLLKWGEVDEPFMKRKKTLV
jgi:hypothetical protein